MNDKEFMELKVLLGNNYNCTDRSYCLDRQAKALIEEGYHRTIWHKVADGDLPKNANYVLVAYHYYSLVSYAIACYKGQLSNNFRKWSTTDDYFKHDDDVIAWAEFPNYKE